MHPSRSDSVFAQQFAQVAAAMQLGSDAGCPQPQMDGGELLRWGSGTSTSSSNDWNDIGLPPLPRQRSVSNPTHWDHRHQHYSAAHQQQLAMCSSVPLPEDYEVHEYDLQACMSLPPHDEALQQAINNANNALTAGGAAGLRHRSCSVGADADSLLYQDASQVWESIISPAAAAALLRAQRRSGSGSSSHAQLHSSTSMCSTTSSSCSSTFNSQPLSHVGLYGRSSGSGSPMAVDHLSHSARSLPSLEAALCRQGGSPRSLLQQQQKGSQQAASRLTAQEQQLLSKLKTIMSEKEQLGFLEKQLRSKIGEEATKAISGSPRAAAQAAAIKASALQQQQQQRSSSASSLGNATGRSPVRHHAAAPSPSSGAASPPRCSNSTAAALMAANADPAVVSEYLHAHKQQQQQHQACMAAVAAAAAVVSGGASPPRSTQPRQQQQQPKRTSGAAPMNPAAMAKLKQLMALQQQQIQLQQELLSLLPPM